MKLAIKNGDVLYTDDLEIQMGENKINSFSA